MRPPIIIIKRIHHSKSDDRLGLSNAKEALKEKIIMIGSMGRNGMTLFLLGVIMAAIGSLIGNGGIITLIMHYLGVSVPALA